MGSNRCNLDRVWLERLALGGLPRAGNDAHLGQGAHGEGNRLALHLRGSRDLDLLIKKELCHKHKKGSIALGMVHLRGLHHKVAKNERKVD